MDSSIITDMETILADSFFSESITHSYPTDQTESLTVQWFNPEQSNDRYELSGPYFLLKTSAAGNIDKMTSRFLRSSVNYKAISIRTEESGLTRIYVSNVDA